MSADVDPGVVEAARAATTVPPREPLPDRERRNPWFRWLIHLGLPLSISLVVHISLLSIMALGTWVVMTTQDIEVGEYEAGITNSLADRMGAAFEWQSSDPLESPAEEQPTDLESLTDLRDLSDVDFGELENTDADEPEGGGFGLGEGGRGGILGIGGGAGEAGSGGFGSGIGGRQRIGRAGVWGLNVGANRLVYVVDYSGSIIVAVDDLKRELKRSVGLLTPAQSFTVLIFYSTGTGEQERFKTDAFEAGLVAASPESKRSFFDWIDRKAPMGSTEPLEAVRRALKLHPDAIFFFSDGYFDDSYVDEIAKSNQGVGATINCLVFDEILLQDTSGLPRLTDGARLLKRVADASGGKTKVVTGLDLKR